VISVIVLVLIPLGESLVVGRLTGIADSTGFRSLATSEACRLWLYWHWQYRKGFDRLHCGQRKGAAAFISSAFCSIVRLISLPLNGAPTGLTPSLVWNDGW
jgi:hypothetical protein